MNNNLQAFTSAVTTLINRWDQFTNRLPKKGLTLLALLIPPLILLSMLYKPLMAQTFGTEIVVQTTPYDPTDLFRGDYVQLFFDMNQIDTALVKTQGLPQGVPETWFKNRPLYVVFNTTSSPATIDYISFEKPESGLYLQGICRYAYLKDYAKKTSPWMLQADYGLDRYFLEEGTGQKLEEAARKGQALVHLKLYEGYGVVIRMEVVKP